ncbi:hypothetical protein QBC32DRAFT_223021 [Pseudoneurospora amorphoporcata]|uniref:Uncharacterized protein n=1 Tax=Pseudoneurospora amorphoporcata TaxID=241081 RepID=A0AAN6NLD1_9PEZI|nr:hypothetical protein QBC32DRAFT_223021 [Pseudoneurospora amorphoporcata]
MADSTSWLRRFQQSRAQPPKQQPQPIITSASEDSFVTSVTTIDHHGDGGNASPSLSHHPAAASKNNKHHISGGNGIRVVGGNAGSGIGNGSGNGEIFGGNATGSGPLAQMSMLPPPPPKTPTAGVFSSGGGGASSTASLRRPSLPHQKSPSDSNVNGTTSSRLLRSRPSATFQRVSSLLNFGGGGAGGAGNGTNSPSATTAACSPSFSSGRPREGSGGSTSRFTFFRPLTPSAAAAPAPSLSALPLSNWSATTGEDEDDWLGGLRRNAARESPWHNPNLMQMAETLQAVMMTKGDSMAALPVQYNSLVHNVLEGFAHLTRRLQALEQELAELKNLREKELEQFRGISEEWIQRENGYKAEIKRLEVVLAKESKDGLASVTLARQDTLIDRSGSKRFQARLKRISTTADRDRAGESDDDRNEVATRDGTRYGIRGTVPHDTSLRNLPMDNDIRISQLVKKRAAEDKRMRRSLLQQSMVPPPSVSVEETLVDSSSPSPPSPTKPYSGSRSSQSQHTGSLNSQIYSPSTSSSSAAITASAEATRSLSQRRNINNLVIETGDISTAVNPRQRRIFSYIEGEAEVLATASEDRQHPFQDYYELANTLTQHEGQSNPQFTPDTNGMDLSDRVSVSAVRPTAAEQSMANNSVPTRPEAEEDSATTFTGTSSRSSNLTGLTPSNSTGSVIWVGKHNSRAAAQATAATTTTTSSIAQIDQPSYYETSIGGGVGIALGGGDYELGEIPSTTTESTAPSTTTTTEGPSNTTYYHYNPTTTTTTMATSPRLGPAIPPRTTSHQQQQSTAKAGSVSPIKHRFEQLFEQQKQSQPCNDNERSPVSVAAPKRDQHRDRANSPSRNKNNVSATVAMFSEGT